MARPRFAPTEAQRGQVKKMAVIGMSHDQIANLLEIAPKTVRRHFRKELTQGRIEGGARLHKSLFEKALEGNVPLLIFLAKSRLGYREHSPEPIAAPAPAPFLVQVEERPRESSERDPGADRESVRELGIRPQRAA